MHDSDEKDVWRVTIEANGHEQTVKEFRYSSFEGAPEPREQAIKLAEELERAGKRVRVRCGSTLHYP